ncbi:MAG: hypothetical protein GYA47_15375 [Desulfovibrio sp.]|nr:hypothetical protein [Desulfovibrio sp.]
MVDDVAARSFSLATPRRFGRLRRAAVLAALVWLLGASGADAGIGSWTITGYVFGPVSAMDKATADSYKGRRVVMDEGSIRFGDETCATSPGLVVHDAATYFGDFRIDPHKLGHAGEKVYVIETGCALPGLSSLLLLDDGRMCFFLDGVFFFLTEDSE